MGHPRGQRRLAGARTGTLWGSVGINWGRMPGPFLRRQKLVSEQTGQIKQRDETHHKGRSTDKILNDRVTRPTKGVFDVVDHGAALQCCDLRLFFVNALFSQRSTLCKELFENK